MSRNILEVAMGAIVLLVAAFFLVFAYSSAQVRHVSGYTVTVRFDHIEGTRDGGDVRISGIKVGSILSQVLDPKTFEAVVTLSIDNSIKLPVDTVATITSSGLLGDKYLQLVPGAEDKVIAAGGSITHAQSPVSLESLLGQFVYSINGGSKPASGGKTDDPPAKP